LVLAVPEANSGHAAAAMTKLLVGVAVFITFLIGLVMMASIGIIGGAASPTAQQELPPNYLALYRSAADTCPGLPWSVLAAIGRSRPTTAGCRHRG
jgi:Na+-transporting methylmalonyl-CoA/oxaloacetate decarboxylase beta subunit